MFVYFRNCRHGEALKPTTAINNNLGQSFLGRSYISILETRPVVFLFCVQVTLCCLSVLSHRYLYCFFPLQLYEHYMLTVKISKHCRKWNFPHCNLFPRENRLSKSWYYWCWGKLRGACNLFNKSRTVFAGAPEFSCFLRSILRGWECPLWSARMFDQLCVFSRAAQTIRKASALWSSPELFSLNSLFPSEFIINDIITSLFLLWLSTFLTNGDLPLGSRRRLWAPAALPLQSWNASPPVPGIRLASVFLWHVPDLRAMADPTSSQGRKKFLGQSKVEFQRMMASCTECGLFPWIIIGSIPFPSLDLLSMYDCFNSLLRNKHLIRPLLPSYSENRKEGLDR